MPCTPPAPGTPRWTQLALLAVVVGGVHLWLLGGEWSPGEATPAHPVAPALTTDAQPARASLGATGVATAPAARAVSVSAVRWIVAPAPAETVPTSAPAAAPAPAPRTRNPPPRATSPTPPPPTAGPSAALAGEVFTPPPHAEPEPEPASPASPDLLADATAAPEPASPPAMATEAPVARTLPPARAPGSAALAYEVSGTVKGIAYQAQATLDWTLEAGRYDARMVVRLPLLGSRVQTSAGQVDAAGLLPERFSDRTRSERAAHFDHAQQRIRFSANTPDAELLPGAQDRLSVFLQLAARLNAAPQPLEAGELIELQVAGTTDAERWRFRVGQEDTLALPAGPLRVREIVREPRQPRDSQVSLWLAPDLQHLPVRIRIVQHTGDQIDQQLSRLP